MKRKILSNYWILFGLLDFGLQLLVYQNGLGVINRGVSFGILVPNLLWVIAFGLVIIFGRQSKLLIIGAMSNLLVRLFLGFVVDYIKIPVINLWFNFSDVLIMLGTGSLIWSMK